jgi:hypothetical protein
MSISNANDNMLENRSKVGNEIIIKSEIVPHNKAATNPKYCLSIILL